MHRSVTHPHQAADQQAYCLEHAPHLAIAPFRQNHAVPAIGALTTGFPDKAEAGQAVFELDAAAQTLQHFRCRADFPNPRVFTHTLWERLCSTAVNVIDA